MLFEKGLGEEGESHSGRAEPSSNYLWRIHLDNRQAPVHRLRNVVVGIMACHGNEAKPGTYSLSSVRRRSKRSTMILEPMVSLECHAVTVRTERCRIANRKMKLNFPKGGGLMIRSNDNVEVGFQQAPA